MDNFMDRLAQRLNAQEMIRANVAAETAELEQLRDQVEAYDASLRKMQVLSDTNAENVVKMEAILDGYSTKLDGYESGLAGYEEKLKEYHEVLANQTVNEDYVTKEELLEHFEGMRSNIQTTQDHIEDFSHKENVKVYRNVQAAVNEELGKKTEEMIEALTKQTQTLQRKNEELSRQMAVLQETVALVKESTDRRPYKMVLFWQILTLIAVIADIALFTMITFGII